MAHNQETLGATPIPASMAKYRGPKPTRPDPGMPEKRPIFRCKPPPPPMRLPPIKEPKHDIDAIVADLITMIESEQ